jgi:hemoglobin
MVFVQDTVSKPDLDSKDAIARLVDAFYARVLVDPILRPLFVDAGQIQLDKHLPLIRAYWEKLLLGEKGYNRHTMNIHRAVSARQHFEPAAFLRWLSLFEQTIEEHFEGPGADRALDVARHIAINMNRALGNPALAIQTDCQHHQRTSE